MRRVITQSFNSLLALTGVVVGFGFSLGGCWVYSGDSPQSVEYEFPMQFEMETQNPVSDQSDIDEWNGVENISLTLLSTEEVQVDYTMEGDQDGESYQVSVVFDVLYYETDNGVETEE
jgi:hypothetical protein